MRVIAFYLPQYYPIPENDKWWGQGFTDWINVVRAKPRFRGHHQPHIPADLGFYDLRLEETRIAQARMAAEYGIGGFCYYHYWFNGKMLLDRPFNDVLQSGRPDFPFCLCWANENWTRAWDGKDQLVLMEQQYAEYDPGEHAKWLQMAFSDRRYIKINGKPLFLIYRPGDIPGIHDTLSLWHDILREDGYPGLYACAVRSSRNRLSVAEMGELGFDAVVEFQPDPRDFPKRYLPKHLVMKCARYILNILGLYEAFSRVTVTNTVSYRRMVERILRKTGTDGTVFPCVMPSWDNSPRRSAAYVIQNDDPRLYRDWLVNAIGRVQSYAEDEQIVFINAWNEWAEGCHLEPDLQSGRKFLEATGEALEIALGAQYRDRCGRG